MSIIRKKFSQQTERLKSWITGTTYIYLFDKSKTEGDQDGKILISELSAVIKDSETKTTLTVNDANVSTYVGTGGSGAYPYLINIPNNVDIVSVETTSNQIIAGVDMVSNPSNGKRIVLIGKIQYYQPSSSGNNSFTKYLYSYFNRAGSIPSKSSPSNMIDAYHEFLYWNSVWTTKGY